MSDQPAPSAQERQGNGEETLSEQDAPRECPFCVMMRKGGCEAPFQVCGAGGPGALVVWRTTRHSNRLNVQSPPHSA
jgi:hypothetical protein